MRMYKLHTLSDDDSPEIRERGEEVREGGGGRDGPQRYIVDLEAGHKPAHTHSRWRMRVSYHYHLHA